MLISKGTLSKQDIATTKDYANKMGCSVIETANNLEIVNLSNPPIEILQR